MVIMLRNLVFYFSALRLQKTNKHIFRKSLGLKIICIINRLSGRLGGASLSIGAICPEVKRFI